MSIDPEVQEMLDHFAIEKVLKRYARALDEKDFDALDDCFTPDAQVDYSAAGGIKGAYPEIKAWLAQVLVGMPEMQHFTTNVQIEIKGDEAAGKSYTLNVSGLRIASGELKHMVVGAEYIDTYRRTAKGWRISSRREERFCAFGDLFGPDDL